VRRGGGKVEGERGHGCGRVAQVEAKEKRTGSEQRVAGRE
jgi:hypothetical protein